jgi:hypothetical protein
MRHSLRKSFELAVRDVTHLCYSHAGAMFAFVVGTVVRYFDAITFAQLGEITHAGAPILRVRGVCLFLFFLFHHHVTWS